MVLLTCAGVQHRLVTTGFKLSSDTSSAVVRSVAHGMQLYTLLTERIQSSHVLDSVKRKSSSNHSALCDNRASPVKVPLLSPVTSSKKCFSCFRYVDTTPNNTAPSHTIPPANTTVKPRPVSTACRDFQVKCVGRCFGHFRGSPNSSLTRV
jgi:hypothetical protein